MQGIRSTMTVPLLFGDEILGILHLDSQIATNAFTEKDLQVLTGIAAQAAIAIQNARLAKKIEHEAHTRAQLERLVPANVVDQMMTGELTIERGGKLCEATMLVADIRGFTAMSEKQKPETIVAMLNEYFEIMVDILFKHGGTLDKFVGDEIIGLFGAAIPLKDSPMRAILCALEMQKALRDFNTGRATNNHEAIKVGIGVTTGQVVTGFIGSSKSMQYTAIGDAMNTAARLQSIAKAGEIIVSEQTMRFIADRVEALSLAPVEVKGKRDRMRVYNVVGMKEPAEQWSESTTT
jgi:adenylate cyclase